MLRLDQLKDRVSRRQYKLDSLLESRTKLKQKKRELGREVNASRQAQAIIQQVSKDTQDNLKIHLTQITSLAISSVFRDTGNQYSMELDFVMKKGKTEVPLYFVENSKRIHPKNCSGGVKEVGALGIQLSCWTLQPAGSRTRNTFILDEPLKWLKGGDLPMRGAEFIHNISSKLGIQIIEISHSTAHIHGADKTFHIIRKGGRSVVVEQ